MPEISQKILARQAELTFFATFVSKIKKIVNLSMEFPKSETRV